MRTFDTNLWIFRSTFGMGVVRMLGKLAEGCKGTL